MLKIMVIVRDSDTGDTTQFERWGKIDAELSALIARESGYYLEE